MDYPSLIKYLYNISRYESIKLGLLNTQRLSLLLNNPDKNYKSIHITGTNGKGSVCKKISTTLMKNKFKVGLYTSPHISTFRERISINDKLISENDIVQILNPIIDISKKHEIKPTFFELTTLLAFKYFKQQNVDIAVIEVGIGGRLDATNIISPDLSVIVSVGLDHADMLGDTIEKITNEKAGIIKYNTPVVIGPTVDSKIIHKFADPLNAKVLIANSSKSKDPSYNDYEAENNAIASLALSSLPYCTLSKEEIYDVVKNTVPSCRFERLTFQNKQVILDVAHNPPAFEALFAKLKNFNIQKSGKLHVVCGFSSEKDIANCLKSIPSNSKVYPVCAPHERAANLNNIAASMPKTLESEVLFNGDIKKTTSEILNVMKDDDVLLVCGSFYILKDVRLVLGFQDEIDQFDLHERTKSVGTL